MAALPDAAAAVSNVSPRVPQSMQPALSARFLALVGAYFLASLAHFSHNAQYIAFYPGMPDWLTSEKVYLAWLAVTSIGALAFIAHRLGWYATSLLLLGLYGAFGLDGLAHYTLALCSEHTLAANVTIWTEAVVGLALLVTSALLLGRHIQLRGRG